MMRKPPIFLAVAVTGLACIAFTRFAHPTPVLVWNASASMPIGFYRLVPGLPERGDLALVRPPKTAEALADVRGYLPAGVPLVKRIAAVGGDAVCAFDAAVFLNGHVVARQLATDHAGRPLPHWNGCRVLDRDEIFVLADAADSFDSRYFGPVLVTTIIGRLAPLWTE